MPRSGWMRNTLGPRRHRNQRRSSEVHLHNLKLEKWLQEKRKNPMEMSARVRTLGYFTLPVLLLVACVLQPAPVRAQMTSVGIECSQIQSLRLMEQENMRAGRALIECGIVKG